MIYGLDDKPAVGLRVILGLQHIFAAFGGIIIVPILVSTALGFDAATSTALISGTILASGLATIVQSRGFGRVGAGVPSLMGTDVTFSAPAISVGARFGLPGIIGAIIAGGFIEAVLAFFTKPLLRFFPRVVAGVVITIIGLTLLGNAMNQLGGGAGAESFATMQYMAVGLGTLVVILLLNHYGRGLLKSASIVIGMAAGYLVSIPLGMVDFSGVREASWFAFPSILGSGVTFHWEAILAFLPAFLVGVVGTVGRIKAIENVVGVPESDDRIQKALFADGLTTVLSGGVGGMTNTTFAQNIGLLGVTKVASRHVTIMAGAILTLLGFLPQVAAVIHAMPLPVFGGAGVVMFGMIAVAGMQILGGVEWTSRNMTIVAVSIGLGLGVAVRPDIMAQFPEWVRMVFNNGITTGTLVAIFLNIALREKATAQPETAPKALSDEVFDADALEAEIAAAEADMSDDAGMHGGASADDAARPVLADATTNARA
jgi:NCS2 family nucleobase:cation symporter-2